MERHTTCTPLTFGAAVLLRIWFNRTFATNLHTIALLRDNPAGEPVRIYGSHADLDSPVLTACDVVELEPDGAVVGEEYVGWALDFCVRHGIDVFIPRLHLTSIAAARHEFTRAGTALVAGPAEAAALLDDKAAAYDDAAAVGLPVPPFRVVRSGEDLSSAYSELAAEVGEVCLKPVTGVGGEGFRLLTRERPDLEDVLGKLSPQVHVDDVASAIDARAARGEAVPPLMLLPFLHGPEVSVDCLANEHGILLAAVPRTKISRRRLLVDDQEALTVARTIVARHRLSSLSNTQVRYWQRPGVDAKPRPYLLETNVRISGGLYQTALSGLNLPWAAVELSLGRPVALGAPKLGRVFTTVSSAVPLLDAHM